MNTSRPIAAMAEAAPSVISIIVAPGGAGAKPGLGVGEAVAPGQKSIEWIRRLHQPAGFGGISQDVFAFFEKDLEDPVVPPVIDILVLQKNVGLGGIPMVRVVPVR